MNAETLLIAIGKIDDELLCQAERLNRATRVLHWYDRVKTISFRPQIAVGVACAVALGTVKPVYEFPQPQETVRVGIVIMNVIFAVLLVLIAALFVSVVSEQVRQRKLQKDQEHCGELLEIIHPDRVSSAVVSLAIFAVGGTLLWAYLSGVSGGSRDPVLEKTYIRLVVTMFALAALYVVAGLMGGVYIYEKVIHINTGLRLQELYRYDVERVDFDRRFCTIIPYMGKPIMLRKTDYKELAEKLRKILCVLLVFVLAASSGVLRQNAAADSQADVRITVTDSSSGLAFQKLITGYEQETGKTVEITIYSSAEELASKLNTELLAGEGPDLFWGSGLPVETLADRGAVVNFLDLMGEDPEIDCDDFFPNILEPMKSTDGGLYLMPLSFAFRYLIPNEQLFEKMGMALPERWTLEEVLHDCMTFTPKAPGGTYAMAWGEFYLPDAAEAELMDALMQADENALKELDDAVLEYLVEPSAVSSSDMLGMNGLYDISPFLYMAQDMTLVSCLSSGAMILFENDGANVRNFPRSANREGECFYTPQFAFCMNSAGNTAEAWQLMKYLLSYEVQTGANVLSQGVLDPSYAIGNPINIAAAMERARIIREEVAEQAELMRNGQPPIGRLPRSKHPVDEWSNRIDDYLSSYERLRDVLTTPVLSDAALKASALQFINEQPDNVRASKLKGELRRMVQVYRGETAGDLEQGYTTLYWSAGGAAAVGAAVAVVTVMKKRRKAKK